jgi:hypothetical protein|uniref:Uncharacterized protein n=1 Tax=viral metagenome TaxID=1070528 RepID=A0A6C0CDW5_9ZZZZ
MNNKIYELTDDFDFNLVRLENPSLISGNNYYSKINNYMKNNLYIQLPKCNTKQGIVNTNNKCFCDLEFMSNNKEVIEFFENLESHCVKEICANKELWFYDSTSISDDDIQEYVVPIMRSYKSGKKFLIKTSIKQDKIIIYDENEKKITLEEYDKVNDIVPLININGIKFSKSSFIIDIILVQFMIIYPCDSFENQILIKLNKPINSLENKKINVNDLKKVNDLKNNKVIYDDTSSVNDEDDSSEDDVINLESQELTNVELTNVTNVTNDSCISAEEIDSMSLKEDACPLIVKEDASSLAIEETVKLVNNNSSVNNNDSFSVISQDSNVLSIHSNALENNPVIEICDLDNIIVNNEPIELKTHDSIYLEIYKKAKQKAKEIRQNAIQAFLEAKNIKVKYNLNTLDGSSSDEESK